MVETMQEQQQSEEHASSKKKHRSVNATAPETITLTRKSIVASLAMPHLHGTAKWTALMKRFTQGCKVTCHTAAKDRHDTLTPVTRPMKTFPTRSSYIGTWNKFGMNGEGTYIFPDKGVSYKGGFEDGVFHGEGELHYEHGGVIKSKWIKGKMLEKQFFFDDGLEYVEVGWAYCNPSDRRYTIEYDNGIEPAGRSYLTAEQPPRLIPPGYYDVGDGFYEPSINLVYKHTDLTAICRALDVEEKKWTQINCRVSPDLPIGPCPFLYEILLEPTLVIPPIPLPQLRCNTYENLEPELEEDYVWARTTRTSSKFLFSSRLGFGSSTDFYDIRQFGSTASQGRKSLMLSSQTRKSISSQGRKSISTQGRKSVSSQGRMSTISLGRRLSRKKISSVAFKTSDFPINKQEDGSDQWDYPDKISEKKSEIDKTSTGALTDQSESKQKNVKAFDVNIYKNKGAID